MIEANHGRLKPKGVRNGEGLPHTWPTLAATVVISLVSADRRLSVTVRANGIVATPTNRPPVTDCYGRTLDELRSSGRLM